MAKGFDCAAPLTAGTARQLREDGYEFVCRYLVPSGWKRLTPAEAEAISAAGLNIVSVYETAASRVLGGRTAGAVDGAVAARTPLAVGQPKGSRIYFSVDFDATDRQMDTVTEYLLAAGEAASHYEAGVFGSAAVIEAAMAAKACAGFWQTSAWSNSQEIPGIRIYPNDTGSSGLGRQLHGVQVDLDLPEGDPGWWNTLTGGAAAPRSNQEMRDYMLSKGDADKVIAFVQAAYMAAGSAESRAEFHRLANELRRASGQPAEE